ncbi:hypothetical protein OG439_12615 [Amycolatopsis sp. NBC_01307]|uniref:hypothetical protein n=1 Tax=Amycolatopsis sp. NBC_01307 TaxID=2903561 RepID=UPI002E0D5648|nr:hypothetical protein OG439_12615 [Amycolatopsis sp. NBC_01307]
MRTVRTLAAVVTPLLVTTAFTPAATGSTVRPSTACGDPARGFTLPGATHITAAAIVAANGTGPVAR